MPGSTIPDVCDALFAALLARTGAGGDLDGVQVLDGFETPDELDLEGVLLADVDGEQSPATLKAGGGTRDELYRVEVLVWARKRPSYSTSEVRARAVALSRVVEDVVHDAAAASPTFGVAGVRNAIVRGFNVRGFKTDRGRECDVRLSVEVSARVPR